MLLLRVRCALLHGSPESIMMPLISGHGMHCLLRRSRLSHVFAPFRNATPLCTALEETEAWDAGTSGEDSALEEASGGLVKACQVTIDNISHLKEDTQQKKEDHPQQKKEDHPRLSRKERASHAEEDHPRLSRKERISHVEDFVRKYVSSHQGQFPTVSTVMKEVGGSRPYIKGILTKLEGNLKSIEAATETHSGSESSDEDDISTIQTSTIDISVSESRPSATAPAKSSTEKIASSEGQLPKGPSQGRVSLWDRLHDVAKSRYQQNQLNNAGNGKPPQAASQPFPGQKVSPAARKSVEVIIEEDESDFSALDQPEADDMDQGNMPIAIPSENEVRGGTSQLKNGFKFPRHGLYVRFLPIDTTEVDLRKAFEDCGEVIRANVVRPKSSDIKFTYGFIDFKTSESMAKALRKTVEIKGSKVMTVETAKRVKNFGKPEVALSPGNTSAMHQVNTMTKSAANASTFVKQLNTSSRHAVLLENVHPSTLSQVKEALAEFGEIVNSYTKPAPFGSISCFEFKTETAKETALSARWLRLGVKTFHIQRADSPKTTVVRITNLSQGIEENRVLSSCKAFGTVEGLKPRMNGVVDVYFHPNEVQNMVKILERLNEVTIDKKRWRAQPAPLCSPKVVDNVNRSIDGLRWIQSQRDRVLNDLETYAKQVIMNIEDLRFLNSFQGTGR